MLKQLVFIEQREGEKPAGFKKASKEALKATVSFWHKDILPRHFRAGASTLYGYAKRTFKFIRRKRKERGFNAALVWTGRSRDLAQANIRIASNTTGARGTMILDHYWRRGQRGPDKMAELTTVIPTETVEMKKVYEKELQNNIDRSPKKKRRVV